MTPKHADHVAIELHQKTLTSEKGVVTRPLTFYEDDVAFPLTMLVSKIN
jgi:hypothetical protein